MGARRQGRIETVKLLYQMDMGQRFDDLDWAISNHFAHISKETSAQVREFAEVHCRGIVADKVKIDECIEKSSKNWRIARMSLVDRNVLRLAVHELMRPDGPPVDVVLDEAIEVGKTLGSSESASFINGVMEGVRRSLSVNQKPS